MGRRFREDPAGYLHELEEELSTELFSSLLTG
jgi:hypothetical protein